MAWNMTSATFGIDSGVADATRIETHGYRGLKPTAKVSHRYAVKKNGQTPLARCEAARFPQLSVGGWLGSHCRDDNEEELSNLQAQGNALGNASHHL